MLKGVKKVMFENTQANMSFLYAHINEIKTNGQFSFSRK
jgi:hypothetical protein